MTEDTRSTCRNVCVRWVRVLVWGWEQTNNGVAIQAGQLSNDRYQLEQRARRPRERERERRSRGLRHNLRATQTSTWASLRVDKEPLTKDNGQRTEESKTHADENLKKNTHEGQQTICGYLSKQVGRAAVAIKIGDRDWDWVLFIFDCCAMSSFFCFMLLFFCLSELSSNVVRIVESFHQCQLSTYASNYAQVSSLSLSVSYLCNQLSVLADIEAWRISFIARFSLAAVAACDCLWNLRSARVITCTGSCAAREPLQS